VQGTLGNGRSYRDQSLLVFAVGRRRGAVLTTSWDRDLPSGKRGNGDPQ